MHFEFLIEDQSGKKCLDSLLPHVLGKDLIERGAVTFKTISYRGIGHLPKNLSSQDPSAQSLMNKLPSLLKGYSQTYSHSGYPFTLVIVCDLDRRCFMEFRNQILDCFQRNSASLSVLLCLAIEEGEAWYLGDIAAVKQTYPKAKNNVLQSYEPDSICNTWETLADAIWPGGLKNLPKYKVGQAKSEWAEKIPPNMDTENNRSPSFCYFRDKLRLIVDEL